MGTTVSNFTLISRRSELENATEQAIERALQAVGIEAQRNVSMKAPVDTGRLAASITYATRRRQGEVDRTYYNQEKARQRNNLLESDDYRKKAEPEKHTVVAVTVPTQAINMTMKALKAVKWQQALQAVQRLVQAVVSDWEAALMIVLSVL